MVMVGSRQVVIMLPVVAVCRTQIGRVQTHRFKAIVLYDAWLSRILLQNCHDLRDLMTAH